MFRGIKKHGLRKVTWYRWSTERILQTVFWEEIGESLTSALNFSFEIGQLPISQRRGIIKLIPKKDGDPNLIKNWRPLTLLNCDNKIASKAIANRIKTVLPELISDDQSGFIKNRCISDNIRTLDSVIQYTANKNIPGLLLFLDFEKAFDTLEWSFIEKSLQHFGFGPSLSKWVRLFYCKTESCILNNGWTSNFFELSRGVRQGCPLSPYLFILSVEILAEAIRNKRETTGIKIQDTQFKLSQYADDTTLILDGSEKSFKASLTLIEAFGKMSGLKLNDRKTEALWIGSKTNCQQKFCLGKNFQWQNKKVKALGVWFSTDQDMAISLNYTEKLTKIKSILGCWKFRRLSLVGKIVVLKSLVASQLVYVFSPLQTNHEVIKEINKLFFNFLWNDKGDKIKRAVMINDYPNGGLKMIDVVSFNKSLKASWIKKYLDSENSSKWKAIFNLELGKYGGKAFFKGNLNKKDIDKLSIDDPFVKEIIDIWSDTFFEGKIVSKDHLLSLPLWQNSLIRINNTPVLYTDWLLKGITQVKHLMDDSHNFMSLESFQNKYELHVKPLSLFGIISAVKLLQRQIPKTQLKHESLFDTFLKSQKSSRIVYQKLISDKVERPLSCQEKWHKDISSTNETVDWRKVYQTSTAYTRSSKLIDFNFRFLHRRLATNSYLHKIGIREDNNCTFCHNEKEDLMHLFWQCEKTTIFWQNLSLWLQSCQILTSENNLHLETALGLKPDSSNFRLQINFCCLLAKQHIWICRLRELYPTQNNFLIYLKHIHLLEKKTLRNTKKWKPFLSSLNQVS